MSAARAPYQVKGWPPADDERLRELWLAGVFVRRIAMALGRSRSTVICRARKIGLGPRAQPVMALAGVARMPTEPQAAPVQLPMLPVPGPAGRPKMPLRLWLVPAGPVRECQWPSGEKPYRFCEAPACPGRPYCLAHSQLAYIGFGRPRPVGHAWVSP